MDRDSIKKKIQAQSGKTVLPDKEIGEEIEGQKAGIDPEVKQT